MQQSRRSRKKRTHSKTSNAGLIFGLAFCLVCGAAVAYLVWGGSGGRVQSQHANVANPQTQHTIHSSRTDASERGNTGQKNTSIDNWQVNQRRGETAILPPSTQGTGEISRVDNNEKKIALTFDAGASAEPVNDLLKVLANYNLHVTFFLTGKWCEQYPDMVKRIWEAGHEIANHTYDHKDLCKLDNAGIKEELSGMAACLSKITGSQPVALARPPYGSRDARVLEQIRLDGYIPIYWSLDSLDAFKKNITSEEIKSRVLERIKTGDIVLMHCGSRQTADALDELTGKLMDRGYSIVRVSELINSKPK